MPKDGVNLLHFKTAIPGSQSGEWALRPSAGVEREWAAARRRRLIVMLQQASLDVVISDLLLLVLVLVEQVFLRQNVPAQPLGSKTPNKHMNLQWKGWGWG